MKNSIIFFIKKIFIAKTIFRRDISVSFNSLLSPIVYDGLGGNNEWKTTISNSIISGNFSTKEGCKISNVICSGNIKLGKFVSLNGPGTRIASQVNEINIGSFTSIASNVIIQEDFHRFDKITSYFVNQNIFKENSAEDKFSKGAITIEEDVWIGSNSVILSGVTIGRGSIIGAGSIVTKNIPKYSIVAGNPAKIIKSRFPDHVITKLEKSKWWEFEVEIFKKYKDDFNKNLFEEDDIFEDVLS